MSYEIFCYGTLMFPRLLKVLLGTDRFDTQSATLRNWECRRIVGESYPGIIPAPGAVTMGVLMQGVCLNSLKVIDKYEGGLYKRCVLPVAVSGKIKMVQVYVIAKMARRRVSSEIWTPDQLSEADIGKLIKKI